MAPAGDDIDVVHRSPANSVAGEGKCGAATSTGDRGRLRRASCIRTAAEPAVAARRGARIGEIRGPSSGPELTGFPPGKQWGTTNEWRRRLGACCESRCSVLPDVPVLLMCRGNLLCTPR
ncbi:hypothetical protein GCM10027271_40650 [Saccharopolyspora gloriosae]